jgi:hypothetical protein
MAQEDIALRLTPEEINLLLEGIGNLPFVRVYNLVGKIQAQASAQLTGTVFPADTPEAERD